jgi:hypothetical protein
VCSAGIGGSGINGTKGAASMGITICASTCAFVVAEIGDAVRARKESSSWAVTLPEEVHFGLTFLRLENILITLSEKSRCSSVKPRQKKR